MKRILSVLPLVALAALAAPAQAQYCYGQPFRTVYAQGSRNKDATLTGTVGLRPSSMVTVTGNVAKPKDPDNGSKSTSYGGRLLYGGDRGAWSVCVLIGAQLGYAHLLNAEGIRHNARITSLSVPLGLGIGHSLRVTKGVRLIVSALPQLIFRNREIMLYSRADTASVGSTSTDLGSSFAADLQVGPVRIGASASRFKDAPWNWTVGAGVGR